MKIYLVGGAVRDKLLGQPIHEKDWVVVGATPDEMIRRGYRQVGKDFPVFLHPKTNEEYALARMERKISLGYKGFTFDASPAVSLEADLKRRDFTINAMAMDENGQLIDPYHGKTDLERKLLRHVSPAFSEDPVRILRAGRFLARYACLGFKVAEETRLLMRRMVQQGEVDALVAERVWKELERALSENHPEKFFEILEDCGALARLFPGLNMQGAGMRALQAAAKVSPEAEIRFAALFHDLPDSKNALAALCQRYRIPHEYKMLAILTAQHYADAIRLGGPVQIQRESIDRSALQILDLLTALDSFRRKQRFEKFLLIFQSIANVYASAQTPLTQPALSFTSQRLRLYAEKARSVDVQSLMAEGAQGVALAKRLYETRLEKIKRTLSEAPGLL
jgi:tRNA nucleotidyltransferase (CCA-adding enzyme)